MFIDRTLCTRWNHSILIGCELWMAVMMQDTTTTKTMVVFSLYQLSRRSKASTCIAVLLIFQRSLFVFGHWLWNSSVEWGFSCLSFLSSGKSFVTNKTRCSWDHWTRKSWPHFIFSFRSLLRFSSHSLTEEGKPHFAAAMKQRCSEENLLSLIMNSLDLIVLTFLAQRWGLCQGLLIVSYLQLSYFVNELEIHRSSRREACRSSSQQAQYNWSCFVHVTLMSSFFTLMMRA